MPEAWRPFHSSWLNQTKVFFLFNCVCFLYGLQYVVLICNLNSSFIYKGSIRNVTILFMPLSGACVCALILTTEHVQCPRQVPGLWGPVLAPNHCSFRSYPCGLYVCLCRMLKIAHAWVRVFTWQPLCTYCVSHIDITVTAEKHFLQILKQGEFQFEASLRAI